MIIIDLLSIVSVLIPSIFCAIREDDVRKADSFYSNFVFYKSPFNQWAFATAAVKISDFFVF